ncbi:MAG TPA: Mur ligase family protein [Solirubrobacteraceae bacterium]|nr:Mur ligase family protein [Solirubrobacteraceae bacterium]
MKIAVARAAGALSRRSGRGATSLPGKLLMRMEPSAIERLARRLPQGSVVISATNGKTTTAAMVAAILEGGGTRLVHNRAGANMAGGVASVLLGAARGSDGIDGDAGVFEVDEFWLDRVVPQLRPRALLLQNLFRDQLDRYGELETIADRWAATVAATPDTTLVLNADDPLVADLGRDRAPATVAYFGVQDDAMALPGMGHASDSKHCRRCGAPYVYDAIYMGHLGHYHCPNGDSRRPQPEISASEITLDGTRGAQFTLHLGGEQAVVALPLPGLYNVYNALGAAALTRSLGAPLQQIVAGLEATQAAFGRAETVSIGDRELAILLVKNPAGANEVLRTLALDEGEHDVLAVLNDNTADGRDISWVWDADFELIAQRVRHVTCSGTRAAELALRLKYAGVPPERLNVVPALERGFDAALADGDGRLVALPTYTAMLALRQLLVARGAAEGSFV